MMYGNGLGLGPRPRLRAARESYYQGAYDSLYVLEGRAGTLEQLKVGWGRVLEIYRMRAHTLSVPVDVLGALAYRESTWATTMCLSDGGGAMEEDDWLADAERELRDHMLCGLATSAANLACGVPEALARMEHWNGLGDSLMGRPSSYLWDNTQHWPGPGRWVGDGRWCASAFSQQFGAAVVFKMIRGGLS